MKSSKHKKQSFSGGLHHSPFNESSPWNWIVSKIVTLQVACEHKVLVVRVVISDCRQAGASGWVCETNRGVSVLCNMYLGLWCAGVELGDGGWWRGEGQVEMCRAGWPWAVKDEREAWTKGPGGRVTSRGGWHLGTSISASVHGGRCWPNQDGGQASRKEGSERLGAQAVKDEVTRVEKRGMRMEYTTHGRFGGLGLKTIGGGFTGLGLKTRAEVPRRNVRHVTASRSSRRGETISWEARWPSDQDYFGLDRNVLG
jgi:hypothetical protein